MKMTAVILSGSEGPIGGCLAKYDTHVGRQDDGKKTIIKVM